MYYFLSPDAVVFCLLLYAVLFAMWSLLVSPSITPNLDQRQK